MHIVFRVDASLQIGSGHLMRCLTLADALRARGASCQFICREHLGHRMDLIEARGYPVQMLRASASLADEVDSHAPSHASWLGCGWREDAKQTIAALGEARPEWLVVDHYALDSRWERELRPHTQDIMVIDDLADRKHDADLLLDQNLGRADIDYAGLLPSQCTLLIGPGNALIRPQFAQLRAYSLARRRESALKHLMISMGGVDADDATGKVLKALQDAALPEGLRITVVMGGQAPWLESVRELASIARWPCDVRVDVTEMAQLMADSDLAIGAAGGTSWERCCLGLPALIVVLADNQRAGAYALAKTGAAHLLGDATDIAASIPLVFASLLNGDFMERMSLAAGNVCNGLGVERVLEKVCLPNSQEAPTPTTCHVRLMDEKDLQLVLSWRNHPEVRRYMYTQHEISLQEHVTWFKRTSSGCCHHLLIVEDAGQALGFVHLKETGADGVAEWGFYAVPDASKGTGRKIAQAALGYAFGALRLSKVCGQALEFNERSINFHRSLGFVDEGVLREQQLDDERTHAVRCFSLLASEWQQHH